MPSALPAPCLPPPLLLLLLVLLAAAVACASVVCSSSSMRPVRHGREGREGGRRLLVCLGLNTAAVTMPR